jgi:ceramide glucosyltransferase
LFEWVCLIPVIVGSVHALLCLLAVARFRPRPRGVAPSGVTWPPVTILKPVFGLEKNLRANLESACRQDYPEFQVVFSVQDPQDPALPLLKDLQEEFGPARLTVAIEQRRAGANGKINNMLGGLAHARYDTLVISDSDVGLRPDYLKTIVGPLADPTVGCACTLYKAVGGDAWFEKLELLTLNADFLPNLVFAYVTGASRFCLGASIALHRSTLRAIGGLEGLADYLVEDYEMGRRIALTGQRVALVPYCVDTVVDLKTPSEWWRHQVYWDQNTKAAKPVGFLFTILTRSIPFALLFALIRLADPLGLAILGGAVGIRLASAGIMMGWGFSDREGLRSLALLPLRDLAGVATWLLAFTKRTTIWRGSEFILTRDGRMVLLEGRACESSSSPATTSAWPSP